MNSDQEEEEDYDYGYIIEDVSSNNYDFEFAINEQTENVIEIEENDEDELDIRRKLLWGNNYDEEDVVLFCDNTFVETQCY